MREANTSEVQELKKENEHLKQAVADVFLKNRLEKPEATPRELAWHITDTEGDFISESSVYRILAAADLITSPAYIVIAAADRFKNPTRAVYELWQTDFTCFRIVGWGWYYLRAIMDDYSRYIIAWKLCKTMTATDVQETSGP